jgi:hypothetical protein
LLALFGAGCVNKPTGFGVNVEAQTSSLSATLRDQIQSAYLHVSGAETFDKIIPGVAQAARSGAMRFHYVPGVHAGQLTFQVDGLAADGHVLGSGMSQPVMLADGKAVDAELTLATNGNGVACSAPSDCVSGNCVDGLCCDTKCEGVCESCKLASSPGVCSAIPQNSDPDQECGVKLASDDGGTGSSVDGGSPAIQLPDGGVLNPTACGGTCSGARSCMFPGGSTSCGPTFCSAAAQVATFSCDGNGGCAEGTSTCPDYACNAGACNTTCATDSDCNTATDYCNLNIVKCVPRKANGAGCLSGAECKSNVCAPGGVCCNTQCDAPNMCNNQGSVGQCQCPGVTCAQGVACQLFYKDADIDGYGDASGTVGAGTAKAGCANMPPPSGFVADHSDCDDKDGNAHPGQTGFFDHPSGGTGTYDYNCDGTIEKGLPELPNANCGYCTLGPPGQLFNCGFVSTCGTAGAQSALGCGVCRAGQIYRFCCSTPTEGFVATTNCGTPGPYRYCYTCGTANTAPGSYTDNTRKQTCN